MTPETRLQIEAAFREGFAAADPCPFPVFIGTHEEERFPDCSPVTVRHYAASAKFGSLTVRAARNRAALMGMEVAMLPHALSRTQVTSADAFLVVRAPVALAWEQVDGEEALIASCRVGLGAKETGAPWPEPRGEWSVA